MKKTAISLAVFLALTQAQEDNCVKCMIAGKCWHRDVGGDGFSCDEAGSTVAWTGASTQSSVWNVDHNNDAKYDITQYYYCKRTRIELESTTGPENAVIGGKTIEGYPFTNQNTFPTDNFNWEAN